MKQHEAVMKVMEENGGYATLSYLYANVLNVPEVKWKTKTPFASMRRIVQDKRFFFKIKPGLWALISHKNKLPENIISLSQKETPEKKKDYSHYYYQGIIVELGNLKKFKTCVPSQDKNKPFLDKRLKDISSIEIIPNFTYQRIIKKIKSIDVIWLNNRGFPNSVFEVEHSTDFKNSIIKFFELRDFNTEMIIAAPKSRKNQFDEIINLDIFKDIKSRIKFRDYDSLEGYYTRLSEIKMYEKYFN